MTPLTPGRQGSQDELLESYTANAAPVTSLVGPQILLARDTFFPRSLDLLYLTLH